ncbi:MAG: tellurite resistance protein [Nevskiales bacterium]|nr:tellurite resistance protein [Nevskiales bacterium]
MPPDFVAYKETPLFTQDTVPAALLRDHSTKRGVWGRIVVREGRLEYRIDIMNKRWNLDPGAPGTIPPEVPHAVQPLGKVAFLVRFFRAPAP